MCGLRRIGPGRRSISTVSRVGFEVGRASVYPSIAEVSILGTCKLYQCFPVDLVAGSVRSLGYHDLVR